MPSRLLREGLLDSERINALSAEGERLFTRLLLVADDFGRFDGRMTVIRARCFPVKRDLTDADVGLWLEEIARQKELVIFYRVRGKPYLEIVNHRFRTRAMRSKYPAPSEGELTDNCLSDDRHVPIPPSPSPSPSPSPGDIGQTPDSQMTDKRQSSDGKTRGVPRETPPEPLTDSGPSTVRQVSGNGPAKPSTVRLHRMEDRFRPPTVEEVAAFVGEKGYAGCKPDLFVAHFRSNGWKVGGRAPMKDWKSAVHKWHLKSLDDKGTTKSTRDEDEALLRRRQILTG